MEARVIHLERRMKHMFIASLVAQLILNPIIGALLGIGADAMRFVRGDLWGDRFTEEIQGGLSGKNTFAGWTFGQEPYLLPDGSTPGISVTICAVDYAGRYKLPRFTE